MEKITAIFEKLDLTKLVPELDGLLSKLQTLASLVILIGPVVMLALGLWYFFLPPKEANHKAGFRTYFGMGSVEAWKFTQKLAGLVLGGLGLVLTIVMGIICAGYGAKDVMSVVQSAFVCLIWQAALALIGCLGVSIVAAIVFDSKGNRRNQK